MSKRGKKGKKRKRVGPIVDQNPGPHKKRKVTISNSYSDSFFSTINAKLAFNKNIYENEKPKPRRRRNKIVCSPETELKEFIVTVRDFSRNVQRTSSQYTQVTSEIQIQLLRFMEIFPDLSTMSEYSQYGGDLNTLHSIFIHIQQNQDLSLSRREGVIVSVRNFPYLELRAILRSLSKCFSHEGSSVFLDCIAFSFNKYRKSPLFKPDDPKKTRDIIREILTLNNEMSGTRKFRKNLETILESSFDAFLTSERLKQEDEERNNYRNLTTISRNSLSIFNTFFEYLTYDIESKEGKNNIQRLLSDVMIPIFNNEKVTGPLLRTFLNSISIERKTRRTTDSPRLFLIEYFFSSSFDLQESLSMFTRKYLQDISMKKIWYTYLDVVSLSDEEFLSIEKYFTLILSCVEMVFFKIKNRHREQQHDDDDDDDDNNNNNNDDDEIEKNEGEIKMKIDMIMGGEVMRICQKKKEKIPRSLMDLTNGIKNMLKKKEFLSCIPDAILKMSF